jgi:hypothetical protein
MLAFVAIQKRERSETRACQNFAILLALSYRANFNVFKKELKPV